MATPENEITRDQIVSGLRALVTGLGFVLGTFGVYEPQVIENWFGQHSAVLIGLALVIVPRIHSWVKAKQASKLQTQQIVTALSLPEVRADGRPTTVADVARITAVRVANAVGESFTAPVRESNLTKQLEEAQRRAIALDNENAALRAELALRSGELKTGGNDGVEIISVK